MLLLILDSRMDVLHFGIKERKNFNLPRISHPITQVTHNFFSGVLSNIVSGKHDKLFDVYGEQAKQYQNNFDIKYALRSERPVEADED